MSRRKVTVHVDAELIAEVRAVIGPEGFVAPAIAEAVALWLANRRDGNATALPEPSAQQPWTNAYRPPGSA